MTLKLVSPTREGAPPKPAKRRGLTRKSEQTRLLILEAAVDSLIETGIRGANIARVAEIAGVTRGCLQYYFMTTEEVLAALAQHVARRLWETYEAEALRPPEGRDLIEFAIDLVGSPSQDRYRIAQLELLTAARTMPVLRPVLEEGARLVEDQAKRFTALLFGNADLADTPQFRAARDLTSLVNDWLFIKVFPGDREARMAEVRAALRIALHTLWRIPNLEAAQPAPKPRVRVKAVSSTTEPRG
jgi:AcrR family transcriptional regulator